MKRSIKKVYNLIIIKKFNAANEFHHTNNTSKEYELLGTIRAYQDVLSLIESSHLLEEDKNAKGSESESLEARCYRLEVEYQKLERGYSNLEKECFKIKKILDIIEEMFNDKVDITELLTYIELDIRANRNYVESPFKQFFEREKYDLLREALWQNEQSSKRDL